MNKQYEFHNACANGDLKLVKKLLKDPEVDPTVYNNYALRLASRNDCVEIVKELLKDKRVDPTVLNNDAICWASQCGHWEIVKLLLDDYRFRVDDKFTKCTKVNKELRDLVPQLIKDLYL